MYQNAHTPVGAMPAADLAGAVVDQRAGHRIHTVCRFAKVSSAHDEGLWRLCNISDRGIMFASHRAVAPGEPLSVVLSASVRLDAVVVWSDDARCGARFESDIDAASLLCALALEQQLPSHRALRLSVDRPALAFDETGMHAVRINDLSHYGVGLCHRNRLRAGANVKLRLDVGIEHRGIVRWANGERAGVRLLDPFVPAQLASACRVA